MNVTHAHDLIAEAFDVLTEELDGWINRLTNQHRTIRIEQAPGTSWYCATIDQGRLIFPPCPNLDTVIRFVRAFAAKEGVLVDEDSVEFYRVERARAGHSVRVPDNVVALPVRAEA